jgi:hypothetical protein
MTSPTIIWSPQPGPQTHLIECPVFEVFFGGARGGGKTEGSLGDWLQHHSSCGPHANGIFVRRTLKQLEEAVARSREIYAPLGAQYREQRAEWTMANGARLKFRYLERDTDADEYQGHSYTRFYPEELTNFPSPAPINKMRATLRSAHGIPCGMRGTGNPGGPGHNWVKARYISPWPRGYKILKEKFTNPFTREIQEIERVFIPSKLQDNPLLMKNDPMYVLRLQQAGSKELVRAWLEGNWDVIQGAFFDEFDPALHVLRLADGWSDRQIPKDALRFRSFDWGSAKPFSVGWYAVSDGTWGLPPKAILKYREWYGIALKHDGTYEEDKGLKLTAEQVAEGIAARDAGDQIKYSVADPQIFVRDGGPSIAERMMLARKAVLFRAGDRKRKAGWDQMRQRLRGEGDRPMLYFLESCEHTIRTIPVLPHDEGDMEDVDTDSEDHAADETRYGCMSRPWIPRSKPQESNVVMLPVGVQRHSFRGMLKVVQDRRKALETV